MASDQFTSFLDLNFQLRRPEESDPGPSSSRSPVTAVAELVSLIGVLAVTGPVDLEELRAKTQLDENQFSQLVESARKAGIVDVIESDGRKLAELTEQFKKAMERVADAQSEQPVGG